MRTRTTIAGLAFLVATAVAAPAFAWDGPELGYGPADGASPGGGGILGTGGAHDHGVTCGDCHVEAPMETPALDFTYSPPMGAAGPDLVYTPGQRYRVDVQLTG